jgi:calcineurin-like phosphoesterase family protein
MAEIFFISDTHFNHANILKFTNYDGTPVRPNFKDVQDMNEQMINNWNAVIKPQDKVYHLGDVAFGNVKDLHPIMNRLNGHKRLILGNHDGFDIGVYQKYFRIEPCWRQFRDMPKKFICTHVPVHVSSLFSNKGKVWNVHGHVHGNNVKWNNSVDPKAADDNNYINISVEKIDYKPVHIEDLMRKMII